MDFKIEMETLENAITTYDNAIRLQESNLDTLNSSLSALKGDAWTGTSKEQFMSLRYGDWEKGLKEHISRFKFLNSMLKEAKSNMEDLIKEGEQLQQLKGENHGTQRNN